MISFKSIFGRQQPLPVVEVESPPITQECDDLRLAIESAEKRLVGAASPPRQRFTAVQRTDLAVLVAAATRLGRQEDKAAIQSAVLRLNSPVAPNQRNAAINNNDLAALIDAARRKLIGR